MVARPSVAPAWTLPGEEAFPIPRRPALRIRRRRGRISSFLRQPALGCKVLSLPDRSALQKRHSIQVLLTGTRLPPLAPPLKKNLAARALWETKQRSAEGRS